MQSVFKYLNTLQVHIFICNSLKVAAHIFSDLVTDAAEILEPSEEKTEDIVEGQNTTLKCIGVGQPPPLVQWRKLNGSLSDRVSITNMSMSTNERNVTRVTVELILSRASREDTGVYECSVANLLNIVTRNISLIVQCMYEFGRPFLYKYQLYSYDNRIACIYFVISGHAIIL